jgi:hypothetical protein
MKHRKMTENFKNPLRKAMMLMTMFLIVSLTSAEKVKKNSELTLDLSELHQERSQIAGAPGKVGQHGAETRRHDGQKQVGQNR